MASPRDGRRLATGEVFGIAAQETGLVFEYAGQSFPLEAETPLEYPVAALPISITFVAGSVQHDLECEPRTRH